MNENYPSSSTDFDFQFLFHLTRAVFGDESLILCGKSTSLKHFKRPFLKFAKGKPVYTINFRKLSSIKKYFLAVFGERVGDNTSRFKAFKAIVVDIGKNLEK